MTEIGHDDFTKFRTLLKAMKGNLEGSFEKGGSKKSWRFDQLLVRNAEDLCKTVEKIFDESIATGSHIVKIRNDSILWLSVIVLMVSVCILWKTASMLSTQKGYIQVLENDVCDIKKKLDIIDNGCSI